MLVFLPVNPSVGVVVAIVLYLAAVGILLLVSPSIAVDGEGLTVGSARLPSSVIGEVRAYSGADATAQRGVKLDARAWLAIRGGISPVVRVVVDDPADPTPYWLIASRRPEALAKAISAARDASRR